MSDVYERAAEIRSIVGYLAEQRFGWVTSQFFGARAAAFLAPVFARTAFQAQCHGVAAAAARLHDEIIGVGRTHHLFRLPEVLEQGVAAALGNASFAEVLQGRLTMPSTALARLQELAATCIATEGAMSVSGDFVDGVDELLRNLAGLYMDAFHKGIKTFPFVREA